MNLESFGASEIAVDRELALSRVGGDTELLHEIAQLFLEDYPRVVAQLRGAIKSGDSRNLERIAHGLKGSVSNFGARAAVEAARAIEFLGREQKIAEAAKAIPVLETTLAALRPELESL